MPSLLLSVVLAASLPGFGVRHLGPTAGFVTSLAVDSRGVVYYTTQDGTIQRFERGASTRVANVATFGFGDSGLLGMALLDDETAIVHYTRHSERERVTHDVVARVDLRSGAEISLHDFACDVEMPARGASTEHHGGNPVLAGDGSVFVGIGEYNGYLLAQLDGWNGGRIWRVSASGEVVEFARGLRNPFDFAWDGVRQRMIVPDNGPVGREDELDVIEQGANCGWPRAFGRQPHPPGSAAPVFVWDDAIVPTGALWLTGANGQLRSGVLITGLYSKSVHYVPDVDARPLPEPVVVADVGKALIDVAQAPDGTIYVAATDALYEMTTPRRGDCDGDGLVGALDLLALTRELEDAPERRIDAQDGAYGGSWGCDVNGDDRIDAADASALATMLGRKRPARHR